jgi:hypothetical protein
MTLKYYIYKNGPHLSLDYRCRTNEVRAVGGETRPIPVCVSGTGSAYIQSLFQERNHVLGT